ncbi:unnamed protein product [Caenorhabditis brenneri]
MEEKSSGVHLQKLEEERRIEAEEIRRKMVEEGRRNRMEEMMRITEEEKRINMEEMMKKKRLLQERITRIMEEYHPAAEYVNSSGVHADVGPSNTPQFKPVVFEPGRGEYHSRHSYIPEKVKEYSTGSETKKGVGMQSEAFGPQLEPVSWKTQDYPAPDYEQSLMSMGEHAGSSNAAHTVIWQPTSAYGLSYERNKERKEESQERQLASVDKKKEEPDPSMRRLGIAISSRRINPFEPFELVYDPDTIEHIDTGSANVSQPFNNPTSTSDYKSSYPRNYSPVPVLVGVYSNACETTKQYGQLSQDFNPQLEPVSWKPQDSSMKKEIDYDKSSAYKTFGYSASSSSLVDIFSDVLGQFCIAVKEQIKTHFRNIKTINQGGYVLHHFISIESELLKFQKHSAWRSPVIEDSDTSNKDRIIQKSKRAIAFHKSNLLNTLSEIKISIRSLKMAFDQAGNGIQSIRPWLPLLAFRVLSARNSYKELRLSQQIQNTAQEEFRKKECWTILDWIISVLLFLETNNTVTLPREEDAKFQWIYNHFENLTETSFRFI